MHVSFNSALYRLLPRRNIASSKVTRNHHIPTLPNPSVSMKLLPSLLLLRIEQSPNHPITQSLPPRPQRPSHLSLLNHYFFPGIFAGVIWNPMSAPHARLLNSTFCMSTKPALLTWMNVMPLTRYCPDPIPSNSQNHTICVQSWTTPSVFTTGMGGEPSVSAM